MNRPLCLVAVAAPLLLSGCLNVRTEPIEVKPIHITVDVNVKVQKELEDVFGALDATDPTLKSNPTEKKP